MPFKEALEKLKLITRTAVKNFRKNANTTYQTVNTWTSRHGQDLRQNYLERLRSIRERRENFVNKFPSQTQRYFSTVKKDFQEEYPKIPRLLLYTVIAYWVGSQIEETLNERQQVRESLQKARSDIDKYRAAVQKQLDQIETVSRSLSRSATASSDQRYTVDKIEKDLAEIDRTIDILLVYLHRVNEKIVAPKFQLAIPFTSVDILRVSPRFRSLKEQKDKLIYDLRMEIMKLQLAKLS